jgi:hypothetical protein
MRRRGMKKKKSFICWILDTESISNIFQWNNHEELEINCDIFPLRTKKAIKKTIINENSKPKKINITIEEL